ncbi:DUF2189 domain-containing protein [Amorphus sp. 3PC139-8]|uniref:DUF2189 domain-containing protein n=1 Tax=Amorphus sp. 3PC139-8 TaxID=2735676 RepID=UPI00345DDEA6
MFEGNVHRLAPPRTLMVGTGRPEVRRITLADVYDSFAEGMADWRETPLFGMLFGAVYAVVGALLIWYLNSHNRVYLVVPALSAFLLIGPGIALGLYEISRRHEDDEPILPRAIYLAGLRHGGAQIAVFGCALAVIAVTWLATADFIHDQIYGHPVWTIAGLVEAVFTTWQGARYAAIGIAVGAVFAILTFCLSVIAAPMLLDRDVDAWNAVTTSIAAVARSPVAFLVYAILVTAVIAAGLAAFLIGLLVALPVVGFATWHLYRRTIVW